MKPNVILITCIIAGWLFPHWATAQTIKAGNDIARNCFSLKDGPETYQVAYKEHGRAYADYYQAVRERIIDRLKSNYTGYYRDGDVDLLFILNFNGSLARIDVDTGRSTDDRMLIDVALLSLQEASPFPPFPKELDERQLPFSVIVSFKRE